MEFSHFDPPIKEPEVYRGPLKGILLVRPVIHSDERGWFMESYNAEVLQKLGALEVFSQDNQSFTKKKGTIRGLHFQRNRPMAKLLRVTQGRGLVVGVDIDIKSPTFGQHYKHLCTAENKEQVYFPGNFAVGFQSLEDNTELQYKSSEVFDIESSATLLYNDPTVAIRWPESPSLVSENDKNGMTLQAWKSHPGL